ncbi:MAG TPA: hypothetical protein PKD00_04065 [Burkholderiales bacterium]|nr:hypothetical protein [Burkholderiales bacterium]
MKFKKIKITEDNFDINLKFYFFLKYLVKSKLTSIQTKNILKIYTFYIKENYIQIKDEIINFIEKKIKKDSLKQKLCFDVVEKIENELTLKLFIFSLKLYSIKDLLLEEAKAQDLFDLSKLEKIDPLSLQYDKITVYSPYSTRVNGALLSLIFFDNLNDYQTNFISEDSEEYIKSLSELAIELKSKGIEPNQIFMLLFNESVNQSIISDSGINYEDRILSVLINIGIERDKITKSHDKNDKSTEFDFFFELNNKTYGIGAKRTLRERYKQFIKTAQMSPLDVMIQITLGIDLTLEKLKSIRQHNIFIFVADEVYNSMNFLKNCEGVYSTKSLTLNTLESLIKINL